MNARAPGLYSLATVAALLAAAGLTGCGGGPAPAVEGPTPSAAPTSTPTVPAAQVDTPTEAEATEEAEEEEEATEKAPAESSRAADLSQLPRQTAVLGILAGATSALHYQEIAEIAGAPASSVTPNLSHLKYRELAETTEPGKYRLAQMLSLESEQEVNEALRIVAIAIVDDQQWDILEAIFEMDERLPFVGFEHFRRNRLANVTGVRWANDRLTHALMKELLGRELIEVYHTDNPRNPDFPTAAIRLTAEGLDEIED